MALLDRFRSSRPAWEDPDPAVRAEAVRAMRADDAGLVARIFQHDAEPLVRRAALRKLDDVALLVEAARADADPGIREEAAMIVTRLAAESAAPEAALSAAAFVSEPRSLAQLARSARLATVREAVLPRLHDERLLATVAKTAEDARIRALALGRVADPALRADIALKSEFKDVATAALEGVGDTHALAAIAEHARAKAAARRARALLEGLQAAARAEAPAPVVAPPDPDETPEQRAEREAREHAVSSRELLIERARQLAEPDFEPQLQELEASWARLPAWEGPEGAALVSRFASELGSARERVEQVRRQAAAAVRAEEERKSQARAADERAERERAEKSSRARLAEICERAQALAKAEAPALREAEQTMRDIRAALEDSAPGVGKREREAYVEKLRAARAALYPKLQELREADEWKRWANTQVQQELIAQTEALVQATDLDQAARELHGLNERWRQFSQARKEEAEALWLRFKTAREALQARIDQHHQHKAEQEARNLARMLELCQQAEALEKSTDWLKTADRIKELQAEWKTIGPAAHKDQRKTWDRFHGACDRFFSARKQDLERRKQDWARNLEAKEALIQKAEALAASSDWEQAAAEIRRLQAEWKAAGPVKKNKSELVWQRFRAACDAFFDRYKRRDDLTQQQHAAAREALVAEIEALVPAEPGSPAPEAVSARLSEILGRWRQAPPLPGPAAGQLEERLTSARDRVVAAWPDAFQGSELDPEANRAKREKLLARVEAIAQAQVQGGTEAAASLADRLREALATNAMGGRAVAEARWREAANEVEQAEAAWKRVGPVPGEAGRALAARFEKACHDVLARRPR